jgi:beta-phosphoglucomutase-like phosphatase (HAD superfamily)
VQSWLLLIDVPNSIRGLIFDCDGTLVDSMPLHMDAWEHAFRLFGAPYDANFIYSKKGMKETEIIALYNKRFGSDMDSRSVVAEKHRHFSTHIQDVRPFAPVVAVARRFHGKLPMAVVSGGVRDIVEGELLASGLADLFDIVLTADDPLPPKPAPDLFLEAARRMRIQPSGCQVFEDGEAGLEAARRAGMLATDVRPFTGQ